MSAGWNGIEDWKCASKGCCYDDKGPFTVGTDNTKVAQPVCFYPNGASSNYDLDGSFKAGGTIPLFQLPKWQHSACHAMPWQCDLRQRTYGRWAKSRGLGICAMRDKPK